MSQSVSMSSMNLHQESIHNARQNRLAATLIYLVRDFKQLRTEINELEDHINTVDEKISHISYKRRRLSAQNFSSSDHLKPTHTKYWSKQQNLISEKNESTEKLITYKKSFAQMARKIKTIKSQLESDIDPFH